MAERSRYVPRRGRVLAAAAVLFAVVYVLRDIRSYPAEGVTFLYVVPISLVAMEFGMWAGIATGVLSLGLFALWSSLDATGLGTVAYFTRGIAFVSVGALTGFMADRLRATADHAAAAARHFELSRDLLCTATFDGYLVKLNGAWEETLGWTAEELRSKPFIEFVHPDDREKTIASGGSLRESGRTTPLLNRYLTKDGGYRWIEWSSSADSEQRLIYGAARDVSDRVEAEQRMREAEARFRRAFEDSPAGMALVGVRGEDEGRIVEVNEALVDLTGLSREDLVGTDSLRELTHVDDVAYVGEEIARLLRGELDVLRIEFRMRSLAGQVRWMGLTSSIASGADGKPLYRISQLQDVDARRRAEERLRHFADHDALSGLYNRRRFHEDLGRELVRGGRGALLLIDLDKFKEVNDTLGHAAGDAVIERVGAALTERLRTSDVCARLGGDEFAILLRRVTAAEADQVAGEVLEHVEAALHATTEGARVCLSIGVAPFEAGESNDPDALLKLADEAMYRAKARGGSAVVRAG